MYYLWEELAISKRKEKNVLPFLIAVDREFDNFYKRNYHRIVLFITVFFFLMTVIYLFIYLPFFSVIFSFIKFLVYEAF